MNRGAQKVKAWRKAQCPKVTQTAFARRFGLSMLTWSRIERGERKPPLEQAVLLERAGICNADDWCCPALPEGATETEAV